MTQSPERVTGTQDMTAGMTPTLMPGAWVYCTNVGMEAASHAFAVIREAEGQTLILPLDFAQAAGADVSLVMRQITLNVYSDLEGVGLTAAVARTLADAGISCNVVAAYHHDHIFVPERDASEAMTLLRSLAEAARTH